MGEEVAMESPATEYDLLLEAPSAVEAELAKELLASHGIPTFRHGRDRYAVALGESAQDLLRPDLYVPKGMRERARAFLVEAWGDDRAPAAEGSR
jgi:hypothetical protein